MVACGDAGRAKLATHVLRARPIHVRPLRGRRRHGRGDPCGRPHDGETCARRRGISPKRATARVAPTVAARSPAPSVTRGQGERAHRPPSGTCVGIALMAQHSSLASPIFLTLGIARTSSALHSLTRKILHSSFFILHFLSPPTGRPPSADIANRVVCALYSPSAGCCCPPPTTVRRP